MNNYSSKLKFLHNLIFLFILLLNIKGKSILDWNENYDSDNFIKMEKSGIKSTYIANSIAKRAQIYNTNNNKKNIRFLINILSIDCKLDLSYNQQNVIKNITHYNYNALSIFLEKESSFSINPLIQSKKEQSQNRKYPLIINRIDIAADNLKNSYIPELNIKGNEPVFLYFSEILKKIKLVYKYNNNNNIEHPIIVSFLIQEKIKFKIEISENENIIINRIIDYKENIIIKPTLDKTYNLIINPEEGIINSTMILKIIQNNTNPFYLQKNQLNLGFLPIGIDYYNYYMEVFKGEEGEIILFNKRQNGILICKIIEKDGKELFPNNSCEFNIYNQKLSFNSSLTEKCEKGCSLLITYYSNISKSLEANGTEFSLLSRIWDKEELISQIIDIPLNEYIFGSYDQTAINIHYYFIFIPYETDDIYIEMHGMNILGYSQDGIIKINTTNMNKNTYKLFDKCENNMIIKLNKKDIGLDSFKGKYISFAFEKDIKAIHSYYYFRIIQQNPINNYTIYPLDTNIENICETKKNRCLFLLTNEYNDLLKKTIIYSFGKNDISYKVFDINDTDYFSSDLKLENLNEINEIESFNGLLNLNLKKKYILVEIESNSTENEILTVMLYSYYQPNFSSISIYSYQLYHLSENTFQYFNLIQNSSTEYRILINNTEGEGNICFAKNCDNNNNCIHLSEQKIYSFSISNKENFYIHSNNNLIYYIKLIYGIPNKEIKELNYQYNLEKIDSSEENFPLIYFIKDIKYNGININFIFKFEGSNNIYNNLIIKGYGVDYSEISSLKDKNDIKMLNLENEIIGKYDNITNSGTIELSNDLIKTKYKETYKYLDDKYFMIIIENNTPINFKNLRNDIYVFSKDENKILLPINKYIRNSYNLLENKNITQKYFFEKEKITNNKFLLEFSSNYKNIELIFNELTKNNISKEIGGFKRYVLSINSNNSIDYYFSLLIKPTNQLNSKKPLEEVNIMIKYYNEEQKINTDYIWDLNITDDKKKNPDLKLIIKNNNEITNSQKDLNYIYYLRLIKKSEILDNEELNTIAFVSSNLSYINQFNTAEINKDFDFELKNLENNENYIASFFIKVENSKKEEANYYSMTYEFNTGNETSEESSDDDESKDDIGNEGEQEQEIGKIEEKEEKVEEEKEKEKFEKEEKIEEEEEKKNKEEEKIVEDKFKEEEEEKVEEEEKIEKKEEEKIKEEEKAIKEEEVKVEEEEKIEKEEEEKIKEEEKTIEEKEVKVEEEEKIEKEEKEENKEEEKVKEEKKPIEEEEERKDKNKALNSKKDDDESNDLGNFIIISIFIILLVIILILLFIIFRKIRFKNIDKIESIKHNNTFFSELNEEKLNKLNSLINDSRTNSINDNEDDNYYFI